MVKGLPLRKTSVRGLEGESVGAVSVQPSPARKLCWTGSSYIYAGPGRKPQLLMHLENYVSKELHTINPNEPKYQELRLQVYRDAFVCFIKEFKTYQPLLSAIRKEYENTLTYQQDHIRELEPLQSHLRLVSEECDRKIQSRWVEEQAEIGTLKREKRQLQEDIEAMRQKEKAMQAVVDHLQSELSNQYLQYREERDARKVLIWQLNDLTKCSGKEEHPADERTEDTKDQVDLQLALKVSREDLTKAQEELNRMKAEYWDVVPRRNWDILEETHKQTLLQLETLQGDFDQLKSEYDTLLELYKRSSMETESHDPKTVQVQAALRIAFPLKSDQEIDEFVASAQSEPDSSNDTISSQRLHILLLLLLTLRILSLQNVRVCVFEVFLVGEKSASKGCRCVGVTLGQRPVAHQALRKGGQAVMHFQYQLLKGLLGSFPHVAIRILTVVCW
ncbi:hypothetical protein PAMP_019273 [Pampus punctatissimus]